MKNFKETLLRQINKSMRRSLCSVQVSVQSNLPKENLCGSVPLNVTNCCYNIVQIFLLFTFSKTAVKDAIAAGNSNVLVNFVGFYLENYETYDLDKALSKKVRSPSGRSSFWWANAFRLMCLTQSAKKKKQQERVAHIVSWNIQRQTQTMRYPRSLPFRWHWTDYPLSATLTTLFKLLKHF